MSFSALPGGGLKDFRPEVNSLKIGKTTASSLEIEASVNVTNPTNYSVNVPYADVHVLGNGTVLGHVTIENVLFVPGRNKNISAKALWDPSKMGGKQGAVIGRELLSQYISGT
jgi:hypothetical protein